MIIAMIDFITSFPPPPNMRCNPLTSSPNTKGIDVWRIMFDIIILGINITVPINIVLQYGLVCFSDRVAGMESLLKSPFLFNKSPKSPMNK